MKLLREQLEAFLNSVLVVCGDRLVTRRDVLQSAENMVRRLRRDGTRRLLIVSDDPAELIAAILARGELGLDLAIGHTHLSTECRERIIADLKIDTIFTHNAGSAARWQRLGSTEHAPQGRILLMTSGTTGLPKIAVHTLENLLCRVSSSAAIAANRNGRWLLAYQATTFAGLQVILTACMTHGTIVVPERRLPAECVSAAAQHRVTHMSGTPTFWRSFLLASRGMAMHELRQVTLGGEAVDQATLGRLAAAFPAARITQVYASTEGGVLFAVQDRRAGFPAKWIDDDTREVRLRIREDELEVCSPRRMLGYHASDASPASDDGWLATGDLVRVEGDRVLFVGRRDSLINVGGSKVSPEEVESFLLAQPGVVEARVRSVPSPITGQVIIGEILAADGRDGDEVRLAALASCRKNLPRHQVPAQIRVVPAIEVQPSGKKA